MIYKVKNTSQSNRWLALGFLVEPSTVYIYFTEPWEPIRPMKHRPRSAFEGHPPVLLFDYHPAVAQESSRLVVGWVNVNEGFGRKRPGLKQSILRNCFYCFLSGLCHVQFFMFVFGMLVIQCNTECVQNLTPGQVVSDTVVNKINISFLTYDLCYICFCIFFQKTTHIHTFGDETRPRYLLGWWSHRLCFVDLVRHFMGDVF